MPIVTEFNPVAAVGSLAQQAGFASGNAQALQQEAAYQEADYNKQQDRFNANLRTILGATAPHGGGGGPTPNDQYNARMQAAPRTVGGDTPDAHGTVGYDMPQEQTGTNEATGQSASMPAAASSMRVTPQQKRALDQIDANNSYTPEQRQYARNAALKQPNLADYTTADGQTVPVEAGKLPGLDQNAQKIAESIAQHKAVNDQKDAALQSLDQHRSTMEQTAAEKLQAVKDQALKAGNSKEVTQQLAVISAADKPKIEEADKNYKDALGKRIDAQVNLRRAGEEAQKAEAAKQTQSTPASEQNYRARYQVWQTQKAAFDAADAAATEALQQYNNTLEDHAAALDKLRIQTTPNPVTQQLSTVAGVHGLSDSDKNAMQQMAKDAADGRALLKGYVKTATNPATGEKMGQKPDLSWEKIQ